MRHFNKRKSFGFFAMVAALLGITNGCKGGGDDVVCMYGVPTVSYELKGKVTNEAGKSLEGIEVSFEKVSPSDSSLIGYAFGPVAKTDSEGQWSAIFQDDPAPVIKVIYQDVDGSENGGHFAADSTIVRDFEPVRDTTDRNPFNLGEVKMEMPAVKMKKVRK